MFRAMCCGVWMVFPFSDRWGFILFIFFMSFCVSSLFLWKCEWIVVRITLTSCPLAFWCCGPDTLVTCSLMLIGWLARCLDRIGDNLSSGVLLVGLRLVEQLLGESSELRSMGDPNGVT